MWSTSSAGRCWDGKAASEIAPSRRGGHSDIRALASGVLEGDRRSVARALSIVEDEADRAAELLHLLYSPDRPPRVVGITGPPGAGKSSLADRLVGGWRASGLTAGVLAVDPSSPFSGGALLGDRLRMQGHATDPGVFIRSMASRGHLGGLAGSTRDAAEVLLAAGFDRVLLETVGVGQAEVEVAGLADVTLLVLVPGAGDEVQVLKAGIMEIGDAIVLNKCDRPGVEQLESAVRSGLAPLSAEELLPPIIRCSAASGDGIDYLTGEVERLLAASSAGGRGGERRLRTLLAAIVRERGSGAAMSLLDGMHGGLDGAVRAVLCGSTTPWEIGMEMERLLSPQPDGKSWR